MGRFILACFGSSSKCCSSSHVSPTRRNQSQEATPSAVIDEQQPIQIEPHDESAVEELVKEKVAIDLNATSETPPDDLLPVNKTKSEDEEKEANYRELSSTKHHPCCDDDKAEESYNDFEVNVVEELESSESLFSLSIDSRKKHHHHISAETEEVTSSSSSKPPFSFPICGSTPANEIKSSTTSSIEFNRSILKPIENLSGWKTTAATSSPLKSNNKNNEEEEVEEKENSLSSWLVDSESTSFNSVENYNNKKMMRKKKNSPDDEPNNKMMMNMNNSPNDETTIGTVASYWLHTGQAAAAATSDSGFTSKKQQQADRDLSLRPCVPLSQLL